MTHRPTGPACGNNPNHPISDGDRQAVEDFKAYLEQRGDGRGDIVRYRKRPVEVDTIRWTGDNEQAVQAFTGGPSTFYALDPADRENSDDPEATATVYDKLHSTWILVYTGQHIVRGVKGEYYPIAEDVLAETYERAVAVSAAVAPPTQAALRDRIADKLTAAAYECDGKCGLSERECYDAHPITFSAMAGGTTHVDGSVTAIADAVLAVLPEAADWDALVREADRLRRDGAALHARAEELDTQLAALRQQVTEPTDRAAVYREAADAVAAHPGPIPYRPQLDEDGGFWWDTRDRDAVVALLRRMADETATQTPAPACAHCGQPVRRVTGTLTAWWVHDPGGNTVCDWARPAHSHRATPTTDDEPAAGARQDGAET